MVKQTTPLYDVSHRQNKEYIEEHKVEKIPNFKYEKCHEEDRDVPLITGFGSPEDLDNLGDERRHMRTDHVGNVGAFLQACPHLDALRALELLAEFPLREAIEKGKTMIMTPRGYVANWVVTQIHEPTDRHFKKADAEQKQFERHEQLERRRLGDAYEPPLVQKVEDLKMKIIEAADPAKINECYTIVNWADTLEAERRVAANLAQARLKRAEKNKKKSNKGKRSAVRKVESKKQFKCSVNNKNDSKLEVKGASEDDEKKNNNNKTKEKTIQEKKIHKSVSTAGTSEKSEPSTSDISAKRPTRSSTRLASSKKNDIRQVSTANKGATKVKKVEKITTAAYKKALQRVWCDKTFVPFSLPPSFFN
ncbi:hypothetical protein CAEBREN_14234 [Caenorhabditis brenneri]|uniref:Uncharacterized protein n=1 Tax=Caenorhabditis brenneri TaxID=135651 RepID=G0PAD6_CAEBE|nr:hypothetical protein CAEBREN_14234 [Caenorhabditis brenneri]